MPAYAVMWFYAEFVVASGAKVDSSVPEEKRGRRERERREGEKRGREEREKRGRREGEERGGRERVERGRRRGREEEERCITLF